MTRKEFRDDVALAILVQMIPTIGNKSEKVKAAFDYADLFLKESDKFIDAGEGKFEIAKVEHESSNKSRIPWLRSKSEG